MSSTYVGVAIVVLGCAAAPSPAAAPYEAHRAEPVVAATPPAATAETAAVETAAASSARASQQVAGPTSGRDDVCRGSINESLQHQLAGRAAQVRFCYERLLGREPQREGRMMVTVRLSEGGTIDRAWITLDELADPETAECALASFKEPLDGDITGNCALVNVPLRFKIKKPEPQQVTP